MRSRVAAKLSRAVLRRALSMAELSRSRTAARSGLPPLKSRRWPGRTPRPRPAAVRRGTPSAHWSRGGAAARRRTRRPLRPDPRLYLHGPRRGGTLGPGRTGRQRFARVGDWIGTRECATELLARERAARKAKLGLWAVSYYDSLDTDNPADVLAKRGRFALVEGKVVSVRESGATIYVNFGRRWTEDFTVTILKRNERSFAAAGLEPKRLAGRRVRVRGWIEQRGGPWIEATRPEQIELIDRE